MGVRPAKRAGLPGATFTVLLMVLLVALPAVYALPGPDLPRHAKGAAPAPSRDVTTTEDKLFLHRHAQWSPPTMMNTTPTSNRQEMALTTTVVEFVAQSPLGSDMTINGKDDRSGGTGKGIWLNFTVAGVYGSIVTITILQDNTTVANGTATLNNLVGTKSDWSVPFANGETQHVFPANSYIRLRITCSRPATLTYNTTDSYILLPLLANPLVPQLVTSYGNGKQSSDFHPYWPDSLRHIRAEGDISSVFGPSDIGNVVVTIRNPSGDISATGNAQVVEEHYAFSWNYSKGQMPGNYNVTVSVNDQQGHNFIVYTMVTMLRYAVTLTSPQQDANDVVTGMASPPRGGSEEKDAVYSLLVLNSGYSATSATVRVSSDPPPGWTATLSTGSTQTINPGATVNITFTVSPNSDVDFGNRAVIYVEAIADADTGTPKASWTVQSVTNATMSRNLVFSIVGASESWVDVGQTVTYQMLAQNKGVLDMNVTFTESGIPVGWSAQLDVSGPVHLDTGSGSQKAVNLKVTAPSEEVANLNRVAQLTVTAQVLEDSTLQKQVMTVTRLITIIGLSVSPSALLSDPTVLGGKVDFHATISNLDPLNSHPIHIAVTQPADWPASSVSFSPKDTLMSPNTTTTIIISVTPPSSAEANTDSGYTLNVTVTPTDQPTRSNATTIVVKVSPRYEITMDISQTGLDASPGQKVTATITVKNLGNSDTVVTLGAAGAPTDWKVKFEDVTAPALYTITLAPAGQAGSMQTVNLTVQPSKSSRDNTQAKVTVTAASGAPQTTVSLRVTVKKDQLAKLVDSLTDSMLLLVLCVLVLIVFAVVLRRSARTA